MWETYEVIFLMWSKQIDCCVPRGQGEPQSIDWRVEMTQEDAHLHRNCKAIRGERCTPFRGQSADQSCPEQWRTKPATTMRDDAGNDAVKNSCDAAKNQWWNDNQGALEWRGTMAARAWRRRVETLAARLTSWIFFFFIEFTIILK